MSVSAANAWAVYQFFNGTYDNVHAAYWVDPPAPSPAAAAAEETKAAATAEAQAQKKKEEQAKPKMVTVELKCLMCCRGCKNSVKKALFNHSAFTAYKVDIKLMKVTVTGENLKPEDVRQIVQKASKKTTEFWPKPPEKKEDKKEEKKEDKKEEKKEDKK